MFDDATVRDQQWVRDYLRGDERAFRAMYRHHTPQLYGLAMRLLGHNERDAEDALQTAWLRAAPRLAEFRWESKLSTWLSGFIVNCARETNRKAKPQVEVTDDTLRPSPVRGIATRIDLERAVANLAPRYREVLVLHDIEGYCHREIADLLGIEEGTSKSQLCRARRAIRNELTPTQEKTYERPA